MPTRRADGSFDWVRRKSDPPPPARPLVRELLLDGRVARTTMLEGTTMLEEAMKRSVPLIPSQVLVLEDSASMEKKIEMSNYESME